MAYFEPLYRYIPVFVTKTFKTVPNRKIMAIRNVLF